LATGRTPPPGSRSSNPSRLVTHPAFGIGLREMLVVGPGLGAWGVMTGVAVVESGIDPVAVLLMVVFVFAGSSQLAALPLLTGGAPIYVVLATAFCVNLRFVVFSAHLQPYVRHQSLPRRLLSGYLFADISYGLFLRRFPEPGRDAEERRARDAYWLGSGLCAWALWAGTGLIGMGLGNTVPRDWGLGFAAILALLAITGSLITTRLHLVSAAVAAVVAILAYALPLKLNILVAIGFAVLACRALESIAPAAGNGGR
jgi:predicted branched-subunit amino acid permease